jgi:hypothetical protein
MKLIFILAFFSVILIGCEKDKVPSIIEEIDYHQSNGNLLVLVVGDSFEEAFEYNLATTQLLNDSLPIIIESVPDGSGWYNYNYWKFAPNLDTIFWTHSNSITFMEDVINSNMFESLGTSVPFDTAQFQSIGSTTNVSKENTWDKVSNLEIVKLYRDSNPNSKIGVSRQVIWIYDDQLGFSIPYEKYLLFLAK